jgi:limonene 1,2-monooxygenase
VSSNLEGGPTRFGIFTPPLYTTEISPTVLYEHELELFELADRLGLQEAWVGEHYSGGHEAIASPELFLAAAAQRTKQIRLGTAVNSLPYHNPFTLAARLAMLDHLTRGRAMMGFGPGASGSDAHMMGIDSSLTRERMLEAAGVIVRLLRGEVVTHRSDWFTLRDAFLQVQPFQRPTLEIVVAAVGSPSGPSTAGRLGIGMINMSATSPASYDALNRHWSIVEAEAEQAGHHVSREQWRLASMTHIAETEEQARADCRHGFEEIWRHLAEVGPLVASRDSSPDELLEDAIASGAVIIGTPDTLIEVIRDLAKQTGGFGTFVMTMPGFADFAARRKALELYATHVVPEFRGHLASLRRSRDWVLGQRDEDGNTIWKTRSRAAVAKATESYDAQRGAKPAGSER